MRFIKDLRTLIERQKVNFLFWPDLFAIIEQLETDETGNKCNINEVLAGVIDRNQQMVLTITS